MLGSHLLRVSDKEVIYLPVKQTHVIECSECVIDFIHNKTRLLLGLVSVGTKLRPLLRTAFSWCVNSVELLLTTYEGSCLSMQAVACGVWSVSASTWTVSVTVSSAFSVLS